MSSATLKPKDPDVAKTYVIDWVRNIVGEALRDVSYEQSTVALPHRRRGFFLECTTAGRTDYVNPDWPLSADVQVADGSVVWTTRHPSDVSIPGVQTAVWKVGSLTLDSQSETGTRTTIVLSGGENGEDYEIECRMTPATGDPIDRTFIVPVRHQ